MSALIHLQKAQKSFGSVKAYQDVSLSVNPGEVIALVGPNGSGKTTLLRSIVGLTLMDNPVEQRVLDVRPPIGLADRKQLLYIPDDDSLIDNITATEYFGLVAHTYGVSVERIQRAVEALESLDFDTSRMGGTLKTYSHGMRKKVQMASMCIPDVPLVIVDEPTNGLDPTAIILLKSLLQRMIAKDRTLLLSTHNLAFAEQLAERVVLMQNGVLYDGSLSELRKSTKAKTLEEAYARLVLHQSASARKKRA